MINKNQLLVDISKIQRSFKLKVAPNIEFKDKIKKLYNWEYDVDGHFYKLGALTLFRLIESYKGRKDIFFKFESPDLKNKFIEQYQRALKKEEEHKVYVEAKKEAYKEDLAYKTHLEEIQDTLLLPNGFKSGFKPYPHQLVAAYFMNRIRKGLLSLQMGLGKTLCSIIFVEMQENPFKKVLVVTPNSLKYNYMQEVEKFTESQAYVYRGLKTKKGKAEELALIKEAKYVIINYEYFNARPEPKNGKKKDSSKRYFDPKSKFNDIGLPVSEIDCVICDESHKLKNEDANTTKNFMATFGDKENLVLLTGTPAPNRIEELWTSLNMLAPVLFSHKSEYMLNYCGMALDPQYGGYVPESPPKLQDIYHMMSPFSFRKTKEEVLKDLPDKVTTRMYIDISDDDMKRYKEVEDGMAMEIFEQIKGNKFGDPNVTLLRLRQYTSYLKTLYMGDILDRMIVEDEKVVVFDEFKESLNQYHKLYQNISVIHTGDIKDLSERAHRVSQFQTNERVRFFFGSNNTCNAGLTLTASNKLILLTQPFSVGENDQLSDRIHRIGQKNFCNIIIPVIRGTFDEVVFNIVENKRRELSLAIDNKEYEYNNRRIELDQIVNYFKRK
jgi:SWI/SNF-related matrix-associated actin-dependent regulator of chromatin subfamily A-like protein 1